MSLRYLNVFEEYSKITFLKEIHVFRFWTAYFKDIDRQVATGMAEFLVAETSLVDCSHGHWVPWAIRLHGVMCPRPGWMEPSE